MTAQIIRVAMPGEIVIAGDAQTVHARPGSQVHAHEGSSVFAWGESEVYAYHGATVYARPDAKVIVSGGARSNFLSMQKDVAIWFFSDKEIVEDEVEKGE